jgi:hypothetical protein
MKIHLLGKHSNRTPFSYKEYKSLFQRDFIYVNKPEYADFLVFGFYIDIKENIDVIKESLIHNPQLKLVILSEEPLWDSLWSGDFTKKKQCINIDDLEIEYYFLNHQTTSIFDFDKIPYFLTTSDDYLVRYHTLFLQNSKLSTKEIRAIWEQAEIKKAFYAEHRLGDKYSVKFPEIDLQGLCSYRTELTSAFEGKDALIVGQGWGETIKRQKLADWHLDKLVALRNKSYIVSALENTHQINYITEKIFDAFAVLAIPVYFASDRHNINKIIKRETYINCYGKTIGEAVNLMDNIQITDEYVVNYKEQQLRLATIFSDYNAINKERQSVVGKVFNEFKNIKSASL